MVRRPNANRKDRTRAKPKSQVLPKRQGTRPVVPMRGRRVAPQPQIAYLPPEDWHEPSDEGQGDYRIVVQDPGEGYMHVVTPQQVRERLAQLNPALVAPLEVVQFSRMTSKKKSFPCYGMQWGKAIYLYPLEDGLVEYFSRPPRPAEYNEARQFGGRWIQEAARWKLVWTAEAVANFYLHNVLIHELGHLLDNRNSSFRDRERYAEWFAIEHGYKPWKASG